jgi:2-polyprenyl-3-methyl-5-hydroxy-6-metoxy-1,4-benzoquinol methylase
MDLRPAGDEVNAGKGCPVCGHDSTSVQRLTIGDIERALSGYFGQPPPAGAIACDYSIQRCNNCTLEFAAPPRPGNATFYGWITGQPRYYSKGRWEWARVLELVGGPGLNSQEILEVGCGAGAFLDRLRTAGARRAIGVDSEPSAVQACEARGLEAHCATVEAFLATRRATPFHWVVMFHCLEHVTAPVDLIKALVELTSQNGRIFVSTPYSPMSFEGQWFDPLNHPPHHLTRWNSRSYRELANRCGLRYRLHMPTAAGRLGRTLVSMILSGARPRSTSRLRGLREAFSRPTEFAREYSRQRVREQVDGRTAADVVLVELSRK